MARKQTQAQIVLTLIVVAVLGLVVFVGFLLVGNNNDVNGQVVAETSVTVQPESVDSTLSLEEVGNRYENGLSAISKTEPFVAVNDITFQSPDDIYWYPVSSLAGPANFTESSSSGFAQTPEGAALAATHIFYRIAGVSADWRTALDTQTVGPGVEARASLAELSEQLLGQGDALAKIEYPAGWDILSYTDTDATVVVYYGFSAVDSYYFRELRIVWTDGDWKLFVANDIDANSGTSTVGPTDVVLEGAFR